MDTIVLGKKIVSRTETVEDYVRKINHQDTIIGISPYYAFWAWLGKKLGIRKKFIYYAIDYYSPEVYKDGFDKFFIPLFIWLDKFLAQRADKVWDITQRINVARERFAHFKVKSEVVPLGYPPSYFRYREGKKNFLVFVGLNPYGLELVDEVKKRLPEIHLITIGLGGLISLEKMLDIISGCGIGISLWKEQGNAYYGDPGKTKLYTTCGIPVITSNFTTYSEIVNLTQCGVSIPYSVDSLEEAIKKIWGNYEFYKKNVQKAQRFCNSERTFRGLRVLE